MPRAGVPRGGHCRSKCPTRLPTGWHRRCWTLFRVQRGRLLTSFRQRVRRTPGEKPRVRTRILLPRPGAPAWGHYRPKEPRAGVPRRRHCRPTNVQRGYRRVGTVGFCHFSGAVRADSRIFPSTSEQGPGRETTGSDSRRAPEAWCSRTGTLRAQIPTRLLTLLSNTPQTKLCYLAAPILFSTVVPFVVCRGQRAILLRGAVHDGRKDQAFPRPSSSGAHHVVA